MEIYDREDVQGFSDITIREQVKFVTDTMEYVLDENEEQDPQDQPTDTELAFTKTNPHAKFVHFKTVTPTEGTSATKLSDSMNINLLRTSFGI